MAIQPSQPVGINPPGATIAGHSVDGVLPDDQRRTGGFAWPPPCGKLSARCPGRGAADRRDPESAGLPGLQLGQQRTPPRAGLAELHRLCCRPADNVWHLPLLDARYGTSFWNGAVLRPGKNFGWTDWLYGNDERHRPRGAASLGGRLVGLKSTIQQSWYGGGTVGSERADCKGAIPSARHRGNVLALRQPREPDYRLPISSRSLAFSGSS